MREKLSLNLYLKKDRGPDYQLLSALYFLDIENSLPLFNNYQLYSAQDLLLDPGLFKLTNSPDNTINLQSRKLEYNFYNENTNIFFLLDVSPSVRKYEGTNFAIQLDNLESIATGLLETSYLFLSKLRSQNQIVFRPKLSVFAFGFPKSDFLNLMTDFELEEGSLAVLKEKISTMFQLIYQKLYSELLNSSNEFRRGTCFSFDSFFPKFMRYFNKGYNNSNIFSKLLLFTDGVCFENTTSIFEALQMNKSYMACDIIFISRADNCISNDLGFLAAKSPSKAIAKLLNGSLYTYQDIKRLIEAHCSLINSEKPLLCRIMKLLLGISQIIKWRDPGNSKTDKEIVEKANMVKPFEIIRKLYYKSSLLEIKNFQDFLQQKIISSWKICYIHRGELGETKVFLKIKLSPKLDLLACLEFESDKLHQGTEISCE